MITISVSGHFPQTFDRFLLNLEKLHLSKPDQNLVMSQYAQLPKPPFLQCPIFAFCLLPHITGIKDILTDFDGFYEKCMYTLVSFQYDPIRIIPIETNLLKFRPFRTLGPIRLLS